MCEHFERLKKNDIKSKCRNTVTTLLVKTSVKMRSLLFIVVLNDN